MSKVVLVTLMCSDINDTSSSDTLRKVVEERVAGNVYAYTERIIPSTTSYTQYLSIYFQELSDTLLLWILTTVLSTK